MKKAVLVLLLAVMGAVCFAELRYSVGSSGKTTVTVWWNDNYQVVDNYFAKAEAEEIERIRIRSGDVSVNSSTFYIGEVGEATYFVILTQLSSYYVVGVLFYLGRVSMGTVYQQDYYNYNAAKQDYDRWCAKYKEYVRKNYHDYK